MRRHNRLGAHRAVACAVLLLATACGGGAAAPTADVDDRVPVRTASVVRGASAPPVTEATPASAWISMS